MNSYYGSNCIDNTIISYKGINVSELSGDINYQASLVSESITNIFNGIPVLDSYMKETKDLLSELQNVSSQNQLLNILENFISHFDINIKRLERAVEVDFNAYLPNKAPILYSEWKLKPENKDKNAMDCLNEIYGKYLQLGILFQEDVSGKKGFDPILGKAVSNYCYRNKLKMSSIIPPKKEKTLLLGKNIDKRKAMIVKSIYYSKNNIS